VFIQQTPSDSAATETVGRRFALVLEYDGSHFAGSQLQSKDRTVQSVLEAAIEKATGEQRRVAFAGRTDAGVHARGHVAAFVSQTKLEPAVLRNALNAWLPQDVAVREVVEAPFSFDPRRDAVRRHYRYVIDDGATRPVLERDRCWHVGTPLDAEAMATAARGLLGCHDFAAFAAPAEREGASTVREIFHFEVSRRGNTVRCDVVGNAFLRHQVRRLVGALVEVGRGKLSVEDYAALLGGAPASAGPSAPAQGLCLMQVEYEQPIFATGLDSEPRLC
jgi:tRNA pseudouridine38-40 synthase